MNLSVHHTTIYRYVEPLRYSAQVLRLTPRTSARQKVLAWELEMPGSAFWSDDALGNRTHCLCLPDARTEISICARGELEISPTHFDPEAGPMPLVYFLRTAEWTQADAEIREFADAWSERIRSHVDQGFEGLCTALLDRVPYVRGMTHAGTTARDAFAIGGGVCQDHSHILLAMARYLGYPARYVSGYLHTDDVSHLSSHAWVEIWYNDAWHSWDVSNQCRAGEQYVQLAVGLEYGDTCPIRGSRVGGGSERMFVFAQVTQRED
jgi:transglutaminase-like putative cysteine protease